MKANEFVAEWRAKLSNLRNNRQKDAIEIANNLAALIKLRIQSEGKDFLGQPFAPYTNSYENFRQSEGYQIDYVDFTVTGRLMANVQPRVTEEGEGSIKIVIGATDQENRNKLLGAVKKRGNILQPSASELREVRNLNRSRLQRWLGI